MEKLSEAKPVNLAAARRIPGVTPAAIVLLLQHVRRQQKARAARSAAGIDPLSGRQESVPHEEELRVIVH